MKKALRRLRAASLVLVLIALAATATFTDARAQGKENYPGILNEALSLYKKGNAREAKLKAQSAYLEVFENLEGPIRINVSAKKNSSWSRSSS